MYLQSTTGKKITSKPKKSFLKPMLNVCFQISLVYDKISYKYHFHHGHPDRQLNDPYAKTVQLTLIKKFFIVFILF